MKKLAPSKLTKLRVAIVHRKTGRIIRYRKFEDPRKVFCECFNARKLDVKGVPVE